MFNYTKSASLELADLIKSNLYFFDLAIQLTYIGYLILRIYMGIGLASANIVLLLLTTGYLLYFVLTTKEFYRPQEKNKKASVRRTVKYLKRLVYVIIIGLAFIELSSNPDVIDNVNILMTLLLIFGLVLSIIFDLVLKVVDHRFKLVVNAFHYDYHQLINEHTIKTSLLDKVTRFDVKTLFPKVTDKHTVKKLKDTKLKQDNKGRRRRDFKRTSQES